jgi:hypothetical protein
MTKRDPLKIFGMIVMIAGVAAILSALPMSGLALATLTAGPITATGVSEVNETRIIIGVILFILGLVAYLGKVGLKVFSGK